MKRIIFALVISMVCMTQAFGAMLSQGTRELSVAGRIDQTDEMNVVIGVGGGYFVRDNVEAGVNVALSWLDGGDLLAFNAGVFGEYNIVLGAVPNVVPYVGASAGFIHMAIDTDLADDSETAIELIGYGGVKYYVVENLAIGTALRVMFATEDLYFGDDEMEAMDWDIILRTSFYF